jgi:hypothetical protein
LPGQAPGVPRKHKIANEGKLGNLQILAILEKQPSALGRQPEAQDCQNPMREILVD